MRRKGIDFKHAPHLSFRYCLEADMARCSDYDDWSESRSSYVVITRKSGEVVPFSSWSRTNMVYGRWRKQTRGAWFWVKSEKHASRSNPDGFVQKWFETYYTLAVYWVESGSVYQGTIRTHEVPDEMKEAA